MGEESVTLPSTVDHRVALDLLSTRATVARLMREAHTAPQSLRGHTTMEPMGASEAAGKLTQGRAPSERKKLAWLPSTAFWQPLKAWLPPKTAEEEQLPACASLLAPLPSLAVNAPTSAISTWGQA